MQTKEKPDFLLTADIEELMPVAEKMTEFIHGGKFDIIIGGGSSATTAAYMVKTWWQRKYPKERMPSFLSLAQIKLSKGKRQFGGVYSYRKSPKKDAGSFLTEKYPGKLGSQNSVFILEEYCATGKTIRNITASLRRIGVNKISAGTMTLNGGIRERPNLSFIGAYVGNTPLIYRSRRTKLNIAIRKRIALKKGVLGQRNQYAQARGGLKETRARIRAFIK